MAWHCGETRAGSIHQASQVPAAVVELRVHVFNVHNPHNCDLLKVLLAFEVDFLFPTLNADDFVLDTVLQEHFLLIGEGRILVRVQREELLVAFELNLNQEWDLLRVLSLDGLTVICKGLGHFPVNRSARVAWQMEHGTNVVLLVKFFEGNFQSTVDNKLPGEIRLLLVSTMNYEAESRG